MRHRAFVVSGVILLAGCPDKNSPERRARAALEKMTQFTDVMCTCKDRACADKVMEEVTAWSTKMASLARNQRDGRADEATMKKMTDIGERFGECMTKAMTATREDVPPPSDTSDADWLLRDARAWARVKQPGHSVWSAQFSFVDARGEIDPERGYVSFVFGGPPTQTNCFALSWTANRGWVHVDYVCNETVDVTNKCSVKQTWKRAIDQGASEKGLATLSFSTTGGWSFVPDHKPVDVGTWKQFDDDCLLEVQP